MFFQDEARFGRICTPVKCWAPKRIRPILPKQIIRQYVYVYSAICPKDGENFSLILPECNTDSMKLFLEEFSNYYKDYRNIMIADQASWHRSEELKQFNNLELIFLPPYSPELNPVEHLWEYLREKYFHNRSWESIDKLEDRLEEALIETIKNKEIVKSFSNFKWLNNLSLVAN